MADDIGKILKGDFPLRPDPIHQRHVDTISGRVWWDGLIYHPDWGRMKRFQTARARRRSGSAPPGHLWDDINRILIRGGW